MITDPVIICEFDKKGNEISCIITFMDNGEEISIKVINPEILRHMEIGAKWTADTLIEMQEFGFWEIVAAKPQLEVYDFNKELNDLLEEEGE